MRRQIKSEESPIHNLKYPTDLDEIRRQLLVEQNNICAYVETYLGGRFDSKDIEHFNPTLKSTEADGYDNWFLVNHQLNNEKGRKARWLEHQPLFHPTNTDFNERIIYLEGEYISKPGDKEALNLIEYLKLNDEQLTVERKRYIKRRKEAIDMKQTTPESYFQQRLLKEPNSVYFIRAIEEEFKIKIQFS